MQQALGLVRGHVEGLGEQRDPLRFARDPKAAMEAGGARMLAQDGEAEGMEGVKRDLSGAVGKQCRKALAHVGGGAAGKGDGEAALRGHVTLGNEVGDAMGQGAGLARAWTGDDQERPLDGGGGRALVVVELCKDAGGRIACRFPDQMQPRPRRLGGLAIVGCRLGRRLALLRSLSLRDRRFEQQCAGGQPLELALLEQADDAVFAVVAGVTDHLSDAQARDRLGEERGARVRDVLDRHRLQDGELGAELGDRLIVAARHGARRRAAGGQLGEDFGQRHQVRHGARGRRRHRLRLGAVGEQFEAVLDADRQRLAAHRATAAMRPRFFGREPHLAFAMAVEVIFPFVGKELDRADIAVSGLQRVLDGEVIAFAVEGGGLPAELAGGMRVRIRGEAVAVEKRHPPVHRRIG